MLWKALGVKSYSFYYRNVSYYSELAVIGGIDVTDGRVSGWRPDSGYPLARKVELKDLPTVDDLLALAVRGEEQAKGKLPKTRLAFDPVTGVPTSVLINWSDGLHDEVDWEVFSFEPAPGEPTATSVS
jgi:Family of unknown function (DUF6174)